MTKTIVNPVPKDELLTSNPTSNETIRRAQNRLISNLKQLSLDVHTDTFIDQLRNILYETYEDSIKQTCLDLYQLLAEKPYDLIKINKLLRILELSDLYYNLVPAIKYKVGIAVADNEDCKTKLSKLRNLLDQDEHKLLDEIYKFVDLEHYNLEPEFVKALDLLAFHTDEEIKMLGSAVMTYVDMLSGNMKDTHDMNFGLIDSDDEVDPELAKMITDMNNLINGQITSFIESDEEDEEEEDPDNRLNNSDEEEEEDDDVDIVSMSKDMAEMLGVDVSKYE